MNPRQTEIIDLLRKDQRLSMRDLSSRFRVSQMTIRRDLTLLENRGFLTRTHGGAVAAGAIRFLQSAFPHYLPSPQKMAIGKLAASLVMPGQTIMLDAGTTALQVAHHLPGDPSITVATVSLCVAQALYGGPIKVLLLGGFLRQEFPSLSGPLTEGILRDLHVDILFMGCDGASSIDGFYTADLRVSSLERAMAKMANRLVVVTESIKFSRKAFVRYATPLEVHTLITDSGLSEQDQANLEERGVTVLIAETE